MTAVPRLELAGVSKSYPGIVANRDVDLKVMPGEIHALLGENGAGKSTLVKFIYGVQSADSGTLYWEGAPTEIASPKAARKLGIGMVFQHFSLFDAMTVEENVAIGIDGARAGPALTERIRSVSQRYGLPLDPGRYVNTLSVGERQKIEVVRCLLQDPKLLIMDEPTSVLTPQEVEILFETLRRLASEGCSVLYISHKLEEIRTLCHSATILRMGEVVAQCDPSQQTARSLAEMMMGRTIASPRRRAGLQFGGTRLTVAGLDLPSGHPHGTDLGGVGFEVRAGEVLGIAGIAGNGQQELMDALSGEIQAGDADTIRIDGDAIGDFSPNARRRAGLVVVPEERLGQGAVPEMSLWENAFLTGATRIGLLGQGFMRVRKSADYAARIVEDFRVQTRGVTQTASSLSGGNLQKFIVGREILQQPSVIVALQPTWGVDAGSAAAIRQALLDLAADGAAVLVISQDLEELFEIADRIAVISEGRLSPPRPTAEWTLEAIGLAMGGVHDGAPETERHADPA